MGFPNSTHIKNFVKGQVVQDISQDADSIVWLQFASGEKLRLVPSPKPENPRVVIATPFRADGVVKQTTEIPEDPLLKIYSLVETAGYNIMRVQHFFRADQANKAFEALCAEHSEFEWDQATVAKHVAGTVRGAGDANFAWTLHEVKVP